MGVPVGTGVTGFGVNTQLDFSGAPTQASVYVPPEAKIVRVMGTLCPATTVGAVETGANAATNTLSLNAGEMLKE
jgi:hypothetical protein